MKRICYHGERGTGKTKLLIKQSLETGIPILCKNYNNAKKYQEQSIALYNEMCKTVTLEELRFCRQNVIVDDAETFLENILKEKFNFEGSIAAFTVSE